MGAGVFAPEAEPEFGGHRARLANCWRACRGHRQQLRSISGLLTPSLQQRVRGVSAAGSARPLEPLHRHGPHAYNDNYGMHVGDRVPASTSIRRRCRGRAGGTRRRFRDPLRPRWGCGWLRQNPAPGRGEVGVGIGGAQPARRSGIIASVTTRARTTAHAFRRETVCGRQRPRPQPSRDYQSRPGIVRRIADVDVLGDLRGAIDRNRLRLSAQAIAPLDARRGQPHFEILLRMASDDGQMLGPDHFLSAALRYQMMPEIDRWVIAQTIGMLQPHAALLADASVVFTINCSGQSLRDEKFTEYVAALIRSSGINPQALAFELTESAAVGNLPQAEQLMRRLQQLGCGIALDDFGTGLSSLAYLRALPITMLKIDGSFVRDVLKDPRAASMIEVIARLAHSMSMTTVAEYVETEEIRTRVTELGVDYGQGFAIARPVPLDEVLAQLPLYAAASGRTGTFAHRAAVAV
jgi:EAL domain-containing protein (putative c-di-GMP-specific phosphodiesterase class I)